MDVCVSYFNSTTQYDIPERLLNNYNIVANPPSTDPTQPNFSPLNTWVSLSGGVTEYDCIGVNYTPGGTGATGANGNLITSYKTLKEWSDVWQDGACMNLFGNMLKGLGTSQKTTAFSTTNFNYLRDDFAFMFSRYFNQDLGTAYVGSTGGTGATGPDPLCNGDNNFPTLNQMNGKVSNADNNCNVYIGGTAYQISQTTNAAQGYRLTIPGQKGYNGFLDTLLNACQSLPGVCEPMQRYMCSECSRQDIAKNPALISFCGCVSPTPGATEFYNNAMSNFDPACDPLCNRIDTVKLASPDTGVADICNASVCVIDAVTINSISSTGTTPVFNQVCPSCANGNGNCICIIDATFENTIPSVKGNSGEIIDNNITFNQYCPNSQCYVANSDTGLFEQVQCSDTLPKSKGDAKVDIPLWVYGVAIGIIIFAILVMVAYKYAGSNVQVYYTGTQNYKIPYIANAYTT